MDLDDSQDLSSRFELQTGIIKNLKYDLPSGLVVFLVAIPMCIGVSLACGTPLMSGIVAGIVGGIIVPFISRSPLSVSGPSAGMITLMGAMQVLGGFEAFCLAIVIAGILQILLGMLRVGLVAYFIPSAILKGTLTAIGIILILKQIPHALGYDKDFEGDLSFFQVDGENTLSELFVAIHHISPGATIIFLISLFILTNWDRVSVLKDKVWLPAPLLVVIVGAALNYTFTATGSNLALLHENMVTLDTYSNPLEFFSYFHLPDFSVIGNREVYVVGFTIAIVASLETLLSVNAVDKLDPFRRDTPLNRELIAQGIGNTISGMIGGLPLTAVIIRSSANINSGGRTRTSAVFHGILLLLSVALLPSILNLIPLSCLAAILIVIGFKLAQPAIFLNMHKQGWDQFIPFVVTIIAILLSDLLIGIGIGVFVGVFFILRSNVRSTISVGKKGSHYLIKLRKDITFLHKATLTTTLDRLPKGAKVIIDGSQMEYIDKDVREILIDFYDGASFRNVEANFVGFEDKIGDGIEEYFEDLEEDYFFDPVEDSLFPPVVDQYSSSQKQ